MKHNISATGTILLTIFTLTSTARAALPEDFEGVTPLDDWSLASNPFVIASDPDNASNHVLNTSGQPTSTIGGAGNSVTGVSLGDSIAGSMSLSFDFYLQDATSADLTIALSQLSVAGININEDSSVAYQGATFRLNNNTIEVADGVSYTTLTQGVASETWYTIVMNVDNLTDTWSGTIVGGAYTDPTALSLTGGDSSFAFRYAQASDLKSFTLRPNAGNVGNGAFLDNIVVIPESSTFALLVGGMAFAYMTFIRRN